MDVRTALVGREIEIQVNLDKPTQVMALFAKYIVMRFPPVSKQGAAA